MKTSRSLLSLAIASSLCAPPARAQDSTLETELAALADSVALPNAPGGVVGILRRGEPIAVRAFGLADVGAQRAVMPTTPFYIASSAKQFTAACVVHAAVAERLSLDDSVTKHVAGLSDVFHPVTLRQLMHHRSGVDDVYELAIALDLGRPALASNAAAIGVLAKHVELDFAPGERCLYSNSGYVLLAEALRGATGKSLGAYAREHFFGPLGMDGARFAGEKAARGESAATSYRGAGESLEPIEIVTGLVGPGGMWASFDDFARWDRAWWSEKVGDARVQRALLAAPELAAGQTLHPVFGPYAGGVMVGPWRGVRTVRHAGGAFGFSAEYMRFPDEGIAVVALSNRANLDARGLAERAAEIALRSKLAAEARTADAPDVDVARFGRMWRDDSTGSVWVLTLKPDRKVVASLGDVKFEVAVESASRLASTRAAVPVALDFEPAEGPLQRMTVRVGGVRLAGCSPVAFPPRELAPASDYAGEYRSKANGATLKIRAEGTGVALVQERPILPIAPFVVPPFHALGADLFLCDAGAQMQFTRDADGRVASVRLDVSRARGLVFERL